jgi:hypothetical protein
MAIVADITLYEADELGCVLFDRETGVAVIVTRMADRMDRKRARLHAKRALEHYAAIARENASGVEGVAKAERDKAVAFLQRQAKDQPPGSPYGIVFQWAAEAIDAGGHLTVSREYPPGGGSSP